MNGFSAANHVRVYIRWLKLARTMRCIGPYMHIEIVLEVSIFSRSQLG